MSTGAARDIEVAVIGAGVVGCAVSLALARRGVAVCLLEAEPEPGLAASGTNSGILHTGFDSAPGECETELILASARRRDALLEALEIPVLRCGAVMRAHDHAERTAIARLRENAVRNDVPAVSPDEATLEIPGEAVTDPVNYTLTLAGAARRLGAELRTRFRVTAIDRTGAGLGLRSADGRELACRLAVNCAGLEADAIARLLGDESFSIYPRKGEFLVFEAPDGPLERIILPVPSSRTKGVLVFPTLDGQVVAGPTAVDLEDKADWSVRPEARQEIVTKAAVLYPPLRGAEPIAAYAGLRPAGRGVNYVIGPSPACAQLVNVAAIRSTGLSASLGIADRVTELVASLGVTLAPEREVTAAAMPSPSRAWWERTARYRAAA